MQIEAKKVVPMVEPPDPTTAAIEPRAIGVRIRLVGDANGAAGIVGEKADPSACCCENRVADLHLASIGPGEIDPFVELVTARARPNPWAERGIDPIQGAQAVGRS